MYRTYIISIRCTLFAALLGLAVAPAHADPADDQYVVAAGHYTQSRWLLAAEEFRSFLREYPSHARADKAAFYLAEALVQAHRYDEAHQAFAEYLNRSPEEAQARQARFRLGEAAFLAGHTDQAKRDLQQFLTLHAKERLSAHVLGYLGEIALKEKNGTEAEQLYARSIRDFAGESTIDEARFGLAKALELQGKHQRAIGTYRKLADGDSRIADRALHGLAAANFIAKDFRAAASAWEEFEKRFSQSPLLPKVRLGLGRALLGSGEHQKAQSVFEKLASDEPLRAEATYWLGITHKAREDWNVAAETLASAAKAYPEHELTGSMVYHAADAFIRAENSAKAVELIEAHTQNVSKSSSAELRYLLAVGLQNQKDHGRAIEVLKTINSATHGELGANVKAAFGHSLYSTSAFAEAIEPLNQYLAAAPDGPAAERCRAELVVALSRNARWNEAREQLEELRTKHPTTILLAPAMQATAEAAQAAGQHQWARELFAALASSERPEERSPSALAGLAQVQQDAGELESSEKTLARLIEEHPKSPKSLEAALVRAQTLEKLDRPDGALAMYHRILESKANSTLVRQALMAAARVHAKLQQHDDAVRLFERFAEDFAGDPEMDFALYGWAWSLRDKGDLPQSEELFQRLHDEHRQSDLWADATYRLAESAARSKDYTRASGLLDELVSTASDTEIAPSAIYLQGQIHLVAGRTAAAVTAFERLVNNHAEHAILTSAMYWQAEAVYRSGNYEKAEELFARLASDPKTSAQTWAAMVMLRHGQALAQQKKWEQALAIATKFSEKHPEFEQQYEADYLLGRCLASQGNFDDARQAYTRVIGSATGGKTETAAMAQWMIGESYFHQQNYESAIREYLRLEVLYPFARWQAGALLQAGKCYELRGEPKEASDLYVRLMSAYPNTEFTEEAAERHRLAQNSATHRR